MIKFKREFYEYSHVKYVELAEKFFREAEEYINKNDSVQASEKLYKVAEECIKALTYYFNIKDITEEVEKLGRWTSRLYHTASREIDNRIKGFRSWWDTAWFLHTEGFHETRLSIEDVVIRKQDIERILKETKRILK